jgi:hypothetical protein
MSQPPPPAPPETPPAPPAAGAAFKTYVPAEFHDREYLKPWLDKPWSPELGAELVKKLDGSQKLIGRKGGMVPEDDKDEAGWTALHERIRPAKPEDYEITVGDAPDEEFIKTFRTAAHESGASKRTVKALTDKLIPFFKGRAEAHQAEMAKMETEYATFAKDAMGEGWDKRQGRVMTAIKELAPEGAKKFIDKLNNNDMALMVSTIDAVLKKYAKEDDFVAPPGGGGTGGQDKEALVAELKTLYANPAYKDFTKPDSAKVRKRVEEILASPLLK